MPRSPREVPGRRPGEPSGGSSTPISGATAAAAVLGLQALFVAGLSVALAVSGFRPGTADRAGAEILALIGLGSAAALLTLARGLGRRRRWARSPTLVLELICLPVAVTVVQGGRWYAGVPLGISAVAVLALMAVSGQLARPPD